MRTLPLLLALTAGSLAADVTVRYKTEVKGSFQALMKQAAPGSAAGPSETKICLKGNKNYTETGNTISIGDSTTKQLILLDRDNQKYATTAAEDYLRNLKSAIPPMPPAMGQLMASFKAKTESRVTGRTETIRGIESEEHEMVMTVDGPAMPNVPPGPMVKVVMQVWVAKPSAMERVPALREVSSFLESSVAAISSNGGMKQLLDMLPGIGDSLASALQDLSNLHSVTTRMHVDLIMPTLAVMMKQLPAGTSPFGADFDPNGPLMQIDQEMVELSTAAVPDSVFEVPADYQKQPIDEFMKSFMAKAMGAK